MKTFLKLLEILELDTDYALGNDIEVINEKDEPYGVKLAKEDLVIINEFKNYPALYRALVTDPKRTIKLINKKLNK